MGERGSAFEFTEDLFFMVEEVANESVGVFLVHRHCCVGAGTENTGSYIGGESGDEGFICRGKFDETGEVSC